MDQTPIDLVIVCGVFIHPAAEDNAKIVKYNHEAAKLAIQRAMKSSPAIAEITAQKDKVEHPFCQVSVAKSRVGARCRDRETSAPRHRPNRTRAAMVPSDAERAYPRPPIRP